MNAQTKHDDPKQGHTRHRPRKVQTRCKADVVSVRPVHRLLDPVARSKGTLSENLAKPIIEDGSIVNANNETATASINVSSGNNGAIRRERPVKLRQSSYSGCTLEFGSGTRDLPRLVLRNGLTLLLSEGLQVPQGDGPPWIPTPAPSRIRAAMFGLPRS